MRVSTFTHDVEHVNLQWRENQLCMLGIGKIYGWWALAGPLSVLVNKVLLEHSHVHSFTCVYSCFCATTTELSHCTQYCMAYKAKNISSMVFYREGWPTHYVYQREREQEGGRERKRGWKRIVCAGYTEEYLLEVDGILLKKRLIFGKLINRFWEALFIIVSLFERLIFSCRKPTLETF